MIITVDQNTRRIFPPSIRRQVGFKTGDQLEVRARGGIVSLIPKLPTADDEYTPEQRRYIDARLARADEDIKHGRLHGPFETHEELIAFLHGEVKKAKKARKSSKPKT